MTPLERFMAKVEKTETCWLWRGYVAPSGYGQIGMTNPRRVESAHRVAYELFVGPLRPEMQVDHLCRNRSCVRPNHLEAVTQRENQRRGLKGALTTHCPQGHPYDEVNTARYQPGTERRQCRACKREHERRRLRDPETHARINALRRARYHARVGA